MIIKGRLYHKVSFAYFCVHSIVRFYNAIPSLFYTPVVNEVSFFFVVGCGHSGTTLMAAKLGNHPDVMGLGRETGVMLPGKYSLLGMSAVANEWQYFAESLGCQCVLEKTPKHIHSYDAVQKVVPNNRFVVMLRNPLDNIASLHKRFNDLDYAVTRWMMDNEEALRINAHENVMLVRYEELTRTPAEVLREVSGFLGIEYSDGMLEGRGSIYDHVRQPENMKVRQEQVAQPIRPNDGGWKKVFSREEARKILQRLGTLPEQLGYESEELLGV